jgi:hypothetical protein
MAGPDHRALTGKFSEIQTVRMNIEPVGREAERGSASVMYLHAGRTQDREAPCHGAFGAPALTARFSGGP